MRLDTPIYFVTYYSHNGKSRDYRTKRLTAFHEHIRKTYPKAYTVKCDKSIPSPLGVWSEVIFGPGNVPVSPGIERA